MKLWRLWLNQIFSCLGCGGENPEDGSEGQPVWYVCDDNCEEKAWLKKNSRGTWEHAGYATPRENSEGSSL